MQEVDDETKETNELSDRRRAPNSDVPSDSNVLNDDDNPEINDGTEPRDSNEQEQWEEAQGTKVGHRRSPEEQVVPQHGQPRHR